MPVELNIVESATTLDTTVVTVILESASEPGPAGPGVPAGGIAGQVLTKDSGTDYDTSWQDSSGGPGAVDAADVTFTPAGTIAATDVQAAVEEVATDAASALTTHSADTTAVHGIVDTSALALTANVQPLDSDLTAIAALTTTSFGRGLLELANAAALLAAAGAAAASHAHAGEDITSGTIADARIASTIARDSEVTSAISALSSVYQPLDADLTTYAGITPSANVQSLLGAANYAAMRALLDLEADTDFPALSTFNDHDSRHEAGGGDEMSIAGLAGIPTELQTHMDDTAGAHAATAISFTPDGSISATTVQAAIVEVRDEATGTSPNDMNVVLHMAVFA